MKISRKVGKLALVLLMTAVIAVAVLSIVPTTPVGAAPPLSGAIFTTDVTGARVNQNLYATKCGPTGVYLDGGPGPNAPATAAGLPDGDYYFQVTDPSGKKLLSIDPVANRKVTVSGGLFVSAVNHQV